MRRLLILLLMCPLVAHAKTVYWVATAYDTNGVESSFTLPVSKDVAPGEASVLSWTVPQMRTDGSAVTLAGFRIYRGDAAGGPFIEIADLAPDKLTYTDLEPALSGGSQITSTRVESAEWTCRDASGAILTSHTRQDKAMESCANQALANPGVSFEIRPSGYRILAQ